ncbi:MAG: hypothetical protein WAQ98_32305 [Blastocatellia bacterium]
MSNSVNQLLASLPNAPAKQKAKIIKELETIVLNIDDKDLTETVLTDLYQLMSTSKDYFDDGSTYSSISQLVSHTLHKLKHPGIKFLVLVIAECEHEFYIPEKCYDQGFYIGDYASELVVPKKLAEQKLFWLFRDFAKAVDFRAVELLVQEISNIDDLDKRTHLVSMLKNIKSFYKKEHQPEFDKLAKSLLSD